MRFLKSPLKKSEHYKIQFFIVILCTFGMPFGSFSQNETEKIISLIFKEEVFLNYLKPLHYKTGTRYFGDSTHIVIQKNEYSNEIRFQTLCDREVLILDVDDFRFYNSRVHFLIDSLIIKKNRACIFVRANLTNGVIIKSSDRDRINEIYSGWIKEQLSNMKFEGRLKKNKNGIWKFTRVRYNHVNLVPDYVIKE
jgi:hypothetical protein